MTCVFLIVILGGATHGRAPLGFAGIAIGLALTLIHLISIPVTNTSVNRPEAQFRRFLSEVGLCPSFGFSGWPQSSVPSSPDGPTCGLVRKIRQGEFQWRATDHGAKRPAKQR